MPVPQPSTYVVHRSAPGRRDPWSITVVHADGAQTELGTHKTRDGAKAVAAILAGWRHRVSVDPDFIPSIR